MKNNNILKTTPYFLIKVLGYVVSMIALPILTNLFSKADFGLISTIEAKLALLISLLLVGMPQSYIRFYNKYKKNNKLLIFNYNYFVLVTLIFIIGFGISYLFFLIAHKDNRDLVILLSLIVGFSVAMQQISSVIRAKEKTFLHAMVLGFNDILGYGLPIICIYVFGLSITNYFISKLVVPAVIFFVIFFLIKEDVKKSKIDSSIIKEILYYGAPLILVSIGGTIFSSGDRMVISNIMGFEAVAVYSVSSKISHSIQQLIIFPINMVAFPMYIRIWEEEGKEKTEQILSKWFIIYAFFAIAIIAGSFSIKEELIKILSNSSYIEGAILIPILVTGLLVYGGYYFVAAGFFVNNKTLKLGSIIIFTSILNIFLNYFIGALLGLIGVAIATAIAYIIFLLISYSISRKIIAVKLNFLQIVKFIISAVIMVIVLKLLPETENIIVNLFFKIFVGGAVYILFNLRFINSKLKNRRN